MKSIKKAMLLILTTTLVVTSCCKKQNSEEPIGAISYDVAKQYQEEYIKTRVKPNLEVFKSIGINKKEDVRDVTFKLETIKQYIAYVEEEASKKGIKEGLGLRIYLGAYKKGDVTMFFMPTKKKEDKTNASKFFYFPPNDEIIDGINGLNMGQGGNPPHKNDLK
mgnify:CR=1 FL=1